MNRKKPEKSKAELEREEKEYKESLERISRETEATLTKWCKQYNIDFESPFSSEEVTEILKVAREEEFAKLLKMFPNYFKLSEWEQLAAKCILKFGLDPKKFSLARKDWSKLNAAIGEKLGASRNDSSDLTNPDLYKFKK